jgi:hypothetical protein
LSFDAGAAIGQVIAFMLFLPAIRILFRFADERKASIILAALIADWGWRWVTERAHELRQFQFQWPAFDVLLAAAVLRWLAIILFIAGLLWIVAGAVRKRAHREPEMHPAGGND